MKCVIETEHLRTFAAVVAEGSFTRAADRLNTNKAHVSRIIARLEEHLEVRLLERTTRAIALTEAGRELHGRARFILAALDETEASLRRRSDAPSGLLRLTCGTEIGLMQVNGWIAEYLRRNPGASVSADFCDRVTDLLHEGLDLAIREGDLTDSTLSARKLGEITYGFFASPGYLQDRGIPQAPESLRIHDLIQFSLPGRANAPLIHHGATTTLDHPARYAANTNMALRDMAAAGLGIALLPNWLAEPLAAEGRLTPILPGWSRAPVPVYAVFPSTQYLTANLRAFIDIARQRFAA
ncbi:MAG: LysR family transcriptional regulator [Cereibacter sphaeroides]|uniref:LysR family transcriptional regulator n=1 Tax=Cereibacter sphaeroides TaxID=1063 RepID=A0A2W5SLU1_CERSP|nr:MAG: LysR family transcriptional regulator [Cereibacter sphaeroides]